MKVDGDRSGPLYQQLRQEIFARIRRGEFASGELLPSENQLCDDYGVSLTTARRALLELVKEGVVRRRIGVGTTVASRIRAAHIAFVSIDYFGDAWREISSAMGELVAGIGELAWKRNASFSMSGVDEENADEHLRGLVEARNVDGVLLRTANDIRADDIMILETAGIPYVIIKRQFSGQALNCVVSDDFLGAQMATKHLIERGHQRIGFICAKPSLTLTQERLAGYRDALATANLAYDERLIRLEPSFSDDMGYRAVWDLLQLAERPTALFAASDTMAIGGYQAAHALGLQIPDDVAFVGYDDIIPVALLHPPLTTVRTAYYDFGRKATELLLDIIDGQTTTPQQVVIMPELIIRASTGEPVDTMQPLLPYTKGILSQSRFDTRRIVVIGPDGPLIDSVTTAVIKTGARLIIPAWQALDEHEVDTVICIIDLRRDIENALTSLIGDSEAAAQSLAKRHGGVLILIALMTSNQQGPVITAAAQAGFAQATSALSKRWSAKDIRINGVLVTGPDLSPGMGTCYFLMSDESAPMKGQVLYIGDPQ